MYDMLTESCHLLLLFQPTSSINGDVVKINPPTPDRLRRQQVGSVNLPAATVQVQNKSINGRHSKPQAPDSAFHNSSSKNKQATHQGKPPLVSFINRPTFTHLPASCYSSDRSRSLKPPSRNNMVNSAIPSQTLRAQLPNSFTVTTHQTQHLGRISSKASLSTANVCLPLKLSDTFLYQE